MQRSIQTLRQLAKIYYNLAIQERNIERLHLHRNVNDLKSTRPVVLLNEIPWVEMNIDHQLTLVCEDPVLREVEDFLRKTIFQYKYFPADMVLKPYLPIRKIIDHGDCGILVAEEIIRPKDGNHIVSHEYHDQLATEEAVDLIKLPKITYLKEETLRRYHLVGEVLGDILPVKLMGVDCLYVTTWDEVAMFRGVTPLLFDLVDRPEFTHKIIRKLTDIHIHKLNAYEELGLFEADPLELHCTPTANSYLKPFDEEGFVTRKNVWGRGAAQILASASGEMRREFDIAYMKETVGQCGLVYYGCCEPLDKMIDVVEEIPNLRKISITPWADVDVASEIIGSRYVLSSKPNPAAVAFSQLNEKALREELSKILDASKRNHCHTDIVLKDISSCHHNPENIFKWEKIAMEMVLDY
ncbi:MAG: hypothetical protein H7X94_15650 [Vallitaleaceae bacterium]|nr:hypothetical protein [Vallitaleaceae bacterium]